MPIKTLFPQSLKNLYHLAQAIVANVWYGFPSHKIKVIGVTGTNGKTTTCQMIAKILEESGARVAMASTINFKLGEKEWVNATKFTTVSAFATQKFIAQAVKTGCKYLVLETSSHSLDQYRVWGIKYDTAVITNVTREHLDYHETMEQYRQAKLKLFRDVKTAIINLDMEQPEDFSDYVAKNTYVYTTRDERIDLKNKKIKIIQARNIKLGIDGSSYQIPASPAGRQNTKYQIQIPGLFNVENALAATCVGISEGIDLGVIKNALEKITKVPGRMDEVENNLGLKIIIDYALTPDSMEKLGALISEQKKANQSLIWVFGACGERDRGKRPMMGEIVSRYADYVIVTNEDPYGEDPVGIINEVFSGVVGMKISNSEFLTLPTGRQVSNKIPNTKYQILDTKIEGKNCWRILDRREAIKNALKLAKPGDIILVTGKGAEETMAVGKERIVWNDRQVIGEELEKI
ncbi:MAG: UDP-N-acetylmuramoyl-L-alanyl-D-glutamate--2,6-diaminopimelate ligase [Candidatus Moranbacteria bacterium]|nr:UDP-N-acetylmuramoyl-L-alanyl-D-glutamate--2,6-diaminopimelate ligase [Candidatus Moranbacteria bacterium]